MDYLSAREAAQRWGVSLRVVQGYCKSARIPGAKKYGVSWLIPADAEKPTDPRKARRLAKVEGTPLRFLTTSPLPIGNPAGAFNGVPPALRPLAAADLAFRRGDPEPAKALWRKTTGEDEAFLSSASLAVAAAISSGDYALYGAILGALQARSGAAKDPGGKALLSLPGVLAAVSMAATAMTPDWLKSCDFSLFDPGLHPFLLYLHAMHLRNAGEYAAALAAARATLLLCAKADTFTWLDVYLYALCAAQAYALGEQEQAERYLTEGLGLAMPYGIIAPFADYLGALGGTLEARMKRGYPQYVKPTVALWNGAFKNWLGFHNAFAKDNITTLLTPREYQAARLAAHGATYAEAAQRMGLSPSRVKNILAEVYGKLYIQNKRELSPFIL